MKGEPYSSKNLWRVLTYGDGIIVMKGTFEEMEQLYKADKIKEFDVLKVYRAKEVIQ